MLKKFALFSVFLAFCVVVFEGYSRLFHAGLDCSAWLGCHEKVMMDDGEIARSLYAAAARTPDAAMTGSNVIYRLLIGITGAAVLLLGVFAARAKGNRATLLILSLASLASVACQALPETGVVDASSPLVISGQILAGFLTLGLLGWLYLAASRPMTAGATDVPGRNALRWLAGLGLIVLALEIALGVWTGVRYAVLACPDFPTCLGSWWPPADYRQAFALGYDGGAGLLPQTARVAIHWAHRLGAVLTFLLVSALAISITSNRSSVELRKVGVLLSFLLLLEVTLGIALVILRMPVALSVAHNAAAALLLLSLLAANYYLRRTAPAPAPKTETTEQLENIATARAPDVSAPARLPEAETQPAISPPTAVRPEPEGLLHRLKGQLTKTRTNLTGFLANLTAGKKAIDQTLLEELEAGLLTADVGVAATNDIIRNLTESLERHELKDPAALYARLREQLYAILAPVSQPLVIPSGINPFVILVVGVNGVGKTTTIGKLAKRFQDAGHRVMLAAGDTFRAAAVEQLQSWGDRNEIPVVAQHTGADSASVIFDALQAAKARGIDILIVDTAGRLHTKSNLMEELKKIKRIIGKLDASAPHEVLLVLDAGTGQNAISQARLFDEAIGLTGIALTKLDGTAKGGVIFALATQFKLPIRFIGIGEGVDDLQDFSASDFIDALFAGDAH
jgi:fused signal recognition particle receptor